MVAPTRKEANLLSATEIAKVLRRGDVVINAAGYAEATDRTPEGLSRLRSSNVEAVARLASAAAEVEVQQLIHVSSVAAMGRVTGLGRDETATGPVTSAYGASKREAEAILAEFRSKLAITILRPTSVFGEGRGLAVTLCRMAQLPVVPLPAGGHSMVPFTYVKNIAEAIALCVSQEAVINETFLIGDEDSYPLREIVAELGNRLGARPRIIPIPEATVRVMLRLQRYAPSRRPLIDPTRLHTLTTSVSYSVEKFRAATGYSPPYSLEDALGRLADWYLGRGSAGTLGR